MAISIVIADDHEVVRAGLKSLLHDTDIKIVAEADNGTTALKLTLKHKPDLALLDVRMADTRRAKLPGSHQARCAEHTRRDVQRLRQSHVRRASGRVGGGRLHFEVRFQERNH